jgi:hypothetical protein
VPLLSDPTKNGLVVVNADGSAVWSGFLKLDQTTPQTIINGVPLLQSTRVISSDNQIIDKKYADNVDDNAFFYALAFW